MMAAVDTSDCEFVSLQTLDQFLAGESWQPGHASNHHTLYTDKLGLLRNHASDA